MKLNMPAWIRWMLVDFERLEESRGKADRKAIAGPWRNAVPGDEAQGIGIGERRAVDLRAQGLLDLRLVGESVAIDHPVAGPVLQRDLPPPTPILGRGAGELEGLGRPCGRHGKRAVARQPLAPVLELGAHGLPDQQRAKTRAVDEEVALEPAAIVEHDRGDVAFVAALDACDLAFDLGDAVPHRILPEIFSVGGRIELVSVVERRRRPDRASGISELHLGVEGHDRVAHPVGDRAPPEMMEAHFVHVRAEQTERVHVGVAAPAPVDELDPELERCVGGGKELVLVNSEQPVELDDRRDRRLADADRADVARLDQRDSDLLCGEHSAQRSRAHPAGGAATADDDAADGALRGHPPRSAATVGILATSASMAATSRASCCSRRSWPMRCARGSAERGTMPRPAN